MGFFANPEVTVVKRGSSAQEQLAALEVISGSLPPKTQQQLESDIRCVKAGIAGERRVLFELENSHTDMWILQDLFLEHGGLTAQIDFLVMTLQRIFVIECKNLYGDIEVNAKGEFLRSFGGRKKEGIYSPITQNERHIELIHAMKRESRSFMTNLLVDGDFNDTYRSLVVLANPKTVLNDRYAKTEVKKKIIRADQLVSSIKAINKEKGPGREKGYRFAISEGAQWFLAQHKPPAIDYTKRYLEMAEQELASTGSKTPSDTTTPLCPRCGAPMVLRTARRGPNAGNQFYGCSNYPACRGIVNIASK